MTSPCPLRHPHPYAQQLQSPCVRRKDRGRGSQVFAEKQQVLRAQLEDEEPLAGRLRLCGGQALSAAAHERDAPALPVHREARRPGSAHLCSHFYSAAGTKGVLCLGVGKPPQLP